VCGLLSMSLTSLRALSILALSSSSTRPVKSLRTDTRRSFRFVALNTGQAANHGTSREGPTLLIGLFWSFHRHKVY
jgi:hypothetical protein